MDKSEKSPVHWEMEAVRIMHELKNNSREFSADDFYRLTSELGMPEVEYKRLAGSLFKRWKAAGLIVKSNRFILSKRNNSTPLPVWSGVAQPQKQLASELEKAAN